MNSKTSIIILTYNNLDKTKDCIESIRKYTDKDSYEIIVVDNNSTDDTKLFLEEQDDIKVIFNESNVGFPMGCNIGIANAEETYDILLLNNDTIVTKNWLSNLKKCLYSDEKIGAVGAVSNNGANLQGVDFTYNNFDEMQNLASKNNISDVKKWEEKVCLIGYCLLIKREVMDQLNGLDEGYTPGYIEDNDLSLNIIKLGYRLMLCHDSFIHHYLGTSFRKDENKFNKIILKNRDYFEKKWNFNVFTFDITKNNSIFLADSPNDVLDYNCGIGTSLLRIKYLFPNAKIIGLEKDVFKREIAEHFGTIVKDLDELNQKFDTIFIGNALETEEKPLYFIHNLKKYLKEDGVIIGEISNIASLKNIMLLLDNEWYYHNFTKQNHFTRRDLQTMFDKEGYKEGIIYPFKEILDDKFEITKINKESINYYYSFKFIKK